MRSCLPARVAPLFALLTACSQPPAVPPDAGSPPDAQASGDLGGSTADAGSIERDTGPAVVDSDQDGSPSTLDCDDTDARRFPGNTEVCDPAGVDEDCDPATLGTRDQDMDRVTSSACCNGAACGQDCDDMNAAVALGFPDGPPNTCDGVDNDCDGTVDEGCVCTGSATRPCGTTDVGACEYGTETCSGGAWGTCLSVVRPAPTEQCNNVDDDCDGMTDEGFPCAVGQSRACDAPGGSRGRQVCRTDCSGYAACTTGTDEGPTFPGTCDGTDNDGDGLVDENFECRRGASAACTSACGANLPRTCSDTCTLPPCMTSAEICNYCDDNGVNGIVDEVALASGIAGTSWQCMQTSFPGTVVRTAGQATCAFSDFNGSETFLQDDAKPVIANGRGAGAVWLSENLPMGYGPLTVVLDVTAKYCGTSAPNGGWALVLAQGGTGDVGTPEGRGVPYSRTGMAVVWNFQSRVTTPPSARSPQDRIEVVRMNGTGGSFGVGLGTGGASNIGVLVPAGNQLNGPAPGCVTVSQPLTVTVTPDDPTVFGNQESITVSVGSTPVATYGFDTNTADGNVLLQGDILAGRPLSIGVVAANEAASGAAEVSVALRRIEFDVYNIPQTPVLPSTATRNRVCP